MIKTRIADGVAKSASKKAGLLVAMWLIPGPIIFPFAGYLFYKWRQKKNAERELRQTATSSSQKP